MIAATSDIGTTRANNEDMFLVGGKTGRDRSLVLTLEDPAGSLFAVADGMGGHAQGEIASEKVLEGLELARREGRLPETIDRMDVMRHVLVAIHRTLHDGVDPAVEAGRMGATIVGLLVLADGTLLRFHAGDSRLYRLRSGILERLTSDHTVREEIQQAGGDPGQVGGHLVTSCIGGGVETPRVDLGLVEDVLPGDRYLLCSDGLTDLVADPDLEPHLQLEAPADAAAALVAAANAAGGSDNITVVILDVA